MQFVEQGSILKRAIESIGSSVVAVYGSIRNIARRLLDCLRYRLIPSAALAPCPGIQIRLDSS